MRHFIYEDSDHYPIALLVKNSAFSQREITNVYVDELENQGVKREDLVVASLTYNAAGKAPVKLIKEHLEKLLPGLDSVSTRILYCADANYFKVLTKKNNSGAHLGYAVPCAIKGYEHMQVVLGINHKSLIYDPSNEPKLKLSLNTLAKVVAGTYDGLGQNIIHQAFYPKTWQEIKEMLEYLHSYPELSADIETFSLDFDKAGIGTISFGIDEHNGVAFACDYYPHKDGPRDGFHGAYVPNLPVRRLLKEFFETYEGRLRWHRANFDLKPIIAELWMENLLDQKGLLEGLEHMTRAYDDTRVIAYLAINSTAGNKLGLKELAHEFAGSWAQDSEDIKDIRRIPLPDLLQYNLIDTLSTNYVYNKYYPLMVADQQEELYHSLMMPSQTTIVQMELTGMPLDSKGVAAARAELEKIIAEQEAVFATDNLVAGRKLIAKPIMLKFEERLQHEAMEAANAKLKVKQHPIEKFADVHFNPGSGPQKQKLLYEELGLPVIDKTKTKQPATGGDTLEKLIHHTNDSEVQDILRALIAHAQATKVLTSFIPAFEQAIDKGDGVVYLHGNFNLGGTKSGRLSSSDPNLQNIPAGSTYGKLIKKCFKAPEGWLFAGADFNSLEDYISALTTKDPNKLKVYIEGYDGHCLRAFSYWPERFPDIEMTPESVNQIKKKYPEDRQESKAPTFALTYQGTYHTLMNNLGFTEQEAKHIEANYHEMYKVSDEWVQKKLDEASQTGHVTVAFGLRLRTPLLAQTIRGHRTTPYEAEAEGRTAGNALGQSYGLLTNRAANEFMAKARASQFRLDIKPVAQIHDAIYILIRNDPQVVEWANKHLIKAMQWQELPEIQHDTVKLGAELDIFYPNWAYPMGVPNNATQNEILTHCEQHFESLKEEGVL